MTGFYIKCNAGLKWVKFMKVKVINIIQKSAE